MAETRNQSLLELNRQLEEVRTSRAQHFEEQKLRNRNLEVQMQELKTILVNMSMNQRSPTSPLNAQSPGEASSPTANRAAPSPHLAAHQLFDELLNPQNCIEHEPCVELSKYNGQGVFEMAGDLSQDLVDGDHDRSTEEVLEVDGDLSQDLVARHVLDEMPQSTKTLKVDLMGILTKDDDDDDLFEMASWIEEDFEPPTYTKGYRRLMCFDPGGNKLQHSDDAICLLNEIYESEAGEVTAKLLCLKNGINGVYYSALHNDMSRYVCCAGYRGTSSGIVFKKTYTSVWKEALHPTLASVAYVLKLKFDVLIRLGMAASYLLNHLELLATSCRNLTFTWEYIYICIAILIFDPGGKWLQHSDHMVMLAIEVFDLDGQCSRFTETWSSVSCLLGLCNQSYELIIKSSSQEQYFCLILGDKDHLKEGVLLQDFGY